mgnify:CR=1 FL=1
MARKSKVEEVIKEETQETSTNHPEYDLYKIYQDYFESQQKQVLETWTAVLNNVFWWTKK